jgi:hypothetical protein
MSVIPLNNPLERLSANPTGMNWRNTWNPTTQYYLNDCVSSPVNVSTFILLGKLAVLGGGDPTANPDWVELSSAATGVVQIDVNPNGLSLCGTITNTIIKNTGVLSFDANTGLVNQGTATNPILQNTGVLALTEGSGIDIVGLPDNYSINATNPNTQPIFTTFAVAQVSDVIPIANGEYCSIEIVPIGVAFNLTFANPVAYTGVWCLDFTGFSLFYVPGIVFIVSLFPFAPFYLPLQLTDAAGNIFVVPLSQGGAISVQTNDNTDAPSAYVFSVGKVWFTVGQLLGAGVGIPTGFRILNLLGSGDPNVDIYTGSIPSAIPAIYYPKGFE